MKRVRVKKATTRPPKSRKTWKPGRFNAFKMRKKTKKNNPNATETKPKFDFDKFQYPGSWLETLQHPPQLNEQDCGNVVYLLTRSDKDKQKLYVGETQDIANRWKQHNCIKGSEEGAEDVRQWVIDGFQAEPVCLVRGFQTMKDALCFETLVQRLRFKQFKNSIENHWKYKKDMRGKPLKTEIRRLLVALHTNRWKNHPLQICWFNLGFRPRESDLQLEAAHSECCMPAFEPVASILATPNITCSDYVFVESSSST